MDQIDWLDVFFGEELAGILSKNNDGYQFRYTDEYIMAKDSQPIAASLPLSRQEYNSKKLFPFFEGLVSEGWLLEIQSRMIKIDPQDYFSFLKYFGEDLIGAVSIKGNM